MGRISYRERLKRLEKQANETTEAESIIAYSDESGIHALKIGRVWKEKMDFPDRQSFDLFVDIFRNKDSQAEVDVLLDNDLLFIGEKTMNQLITSASNDTLQKIVNNDLTDKEKIELQTAFAAMILSKV